MTLTRSLLFLQLVALVASVFIVSTTAQAGVTFSVDATTDGTGLTALVPGDTVTLDITVRSSDLPVALNASVNDYDTSVVSLDSGASLVTDELFANVCAPPPLGCFGGITNEISSVQEEAFGPGVRSPFFMGLTITRSATDGTLDRGVVTGVSGDAQFRTVFIAAGLGQTTLQIGAFSEYDGGYVEDPGDQQISNAFVDLVVVPEPGTALLLGLGLTGLASRRSRLGTVHR